MTLELEFDVPGGALLPAELARLCLDVQHQAIAVALLSSSRVRGASAPGRTRWTHDRSMLSYKFMAESTRADLRDIPLEVDIVGLKFGSPLIVTVIIKFATALGSAPVQVFRTIYERILLGDLERQKRQLEIDMMREDLRHKQFDNRVKEVHELLGLNDTLTGHPNIDQSIRDHMISSIAPFDSVLSKSQELSRLETRRLVRASIKEPEDKPRGR